MTSSLNGIIQNPALHSTGSSFSDTGTTLKPDNSLRARFLRLGAVRRPAYEAADTGLFSSDLAAGIRRVKGVKKLGVRLGSWLTASLTRNHLEQM